MLDNQDKEESKTKPQALVQSTEEKVEDLIDTSGFDDDIFETEDNIFWIFQKVFWGFMKTVLILGMFGFLLWVIWSPSDDSEVGQEKTPQKEIPSKTEEKQVPQVKKEDLKEVKKPIPKKEPKAEPPKVIQNDTDIISQAVLWLKNAKQIGSTPRISIRDAASSDFKGERIEAWVYKSNNLLNQYQQIESQIVESRNSLLAEGSRLNQEILQADRDLKESIRLLDTQGIKHHLQRKIQLQQNAAKYLGEAKVRNTLVKNLRNFFILLNQQSVPSIDGTELISKP